MSDNYNDDDLDFEFEDEDFRDDGLIKFEELKGICERHIENGNDPYTEDEFRQIVQWAEETIMNNSILGLVLDGTLDVIFDPDQIKQLGEDGLLFALSPDAKKEIENREDILPPGGFVNLDFGEKEEE